CRVGPGPAARDAAAGGPSDRDGGCGRAGRGGSTRAGCESARRRVPPTFPMAAPWGLRPWRRLSASVLCAAEAPDASTGGQLWREEGGEGGLQVCVTGATAAPARDLRSVAACVC